MKSVLIIDDRQDEFDSLRNWLMANRYPVLPLDFDEMSDKMFASYNGQPSALEEYIIKLIQEHSNDIGLILCDIYFYEDPTGGNKIIQAIRNFKGINPSNWASDIPIFAVTKFPDLQPAIIVDGADFYIEKKEFKDDSKCLSISRLIETHMKRFADRLKSTYPPEPHIREAIEKYKQDNEGEKTAFIMTSFREEHRIYVESIRKILEQKKIVGHLASDKQYCESVWDNVQVYLHGCDFGIGIYADDSLIPRDKIIDEDLYKIIRINPNMSQEVGYLLSLKKKLCVLKEEKLKEVPSDMATKFYRKFSISNYEELEKWLDENGFGSA